MQCNHAIDIGAILAGEVACPFCENERLNRVVLELNEIAEMRKTAKDLIREAFDLRTKEFDRAEILNSELTIFLEALYTAAYPFRGNGDIDKACGGVTDLLARAKAKQ